MLSIRTLNNVLLVRPLASVQVIQCAGLKRFNPPIKYDDISYPERSRLPIMPRSPQYPSNLRPPKMTKRLMLMRGPEEVHNTLLHEQYGVMATGGGRLKFNHYEMIRMSVVKNLDMKRMFAMWRVPPPWQPVTKKAKGMKMGGGKAAIDHYATPIRPNRIIFEVGGVVEYEEVKAFLKSIAERLPFKAMAVSHQILEDMANKKERLKAANTNPYTMKYAIQNNLNGIQSFIRPTDHKWYGEYL